MLNAEVFLACNALTALLNAQDFVELAVFLELTALLAKGPQDIHSAVMFALVPQDTFTIQEQTPAINALGSVEPVRPHQLIA